MFLVALYRFAHERQHSLCFAPERREYKEERETRAIFWGKVHLSFDEDSGEGKLIIKVWVLEERGKLGRPTPSKF